MHHLKRAGYPVLILLLLFSCSSQGPLTPEGALSALNRAFSTGDVLLMKKIISSDSIARIEAVTGEFNRMPESQIRSVSELYGIDPARLKGLSVDGFISIYLSSQKNIIFEEPASITGVRASETRAVVLLQNGNEVDFVREGPYWKFDLTGL